MRPAAARALSPSSIALPILSPRAEQLGLLQGQRQLLIDLERCTRCDQCVQACVAAHDDGLPRLIREGPRLDQHLVPARCRSCLDPVCMIGCPVGSIARRDDLSMFIEDWCIGCGICADNCPYGAIQMHPVPVREGFGAGPRVAPPPAAQIAAVCDQCHGVAAGPACQYACPHDAVSISDCSSAFESQIPLALSTLTLNAQIRPAERGEYLSTADLSRPRTLGPSPVR